jgi:hypothetical protein
MWSEGLTAFREAGAGAVKAASGVHLYFRIAHRTQAARAAASNINAIPGPVVAKAKLGRARFSYRLN